MTYQELADVVANMSNGTSEYGYHKEYVPAYQEFALELGRRLDARLSELDISIPRAVRRTGVPTLAFASIYRSRKPGRGYSLTAFNTAVLCYNIFHISVHEFLSDETPTIQLPATLQLVAKTMAKLSPAKRREVRDELARVREEASKEMDLDLWREPILGPRLYELFNDKYQSYASFMGYDNGKSGKNRGPYALQASILNGSPDNPDGLRTLLRGVLFVSFRTGIPIDYFLAMDYTPYADIVYRGGNGRKVPVEDRDTLYVLRWLLAFPVEKQANLIGQMVAKYR